MSTYVEHRLVGAPWQINTLPDGTKELVFLFPEQSEAYVYILTKKVAGEIASQLGCPKLPPPPAPPRPGFQSTPLKFRVDDRDDKTPYEDK